MVSEYVDDFCFIDFVNHREFNDLTLEFFMQNFQIDLVAFEPSQGELVASEDALNG